MRSDAQLFLDPHDSVGRIWCILYRSNLYIAYFFFAKFAVNCRWEFYPYLHRISTSLVLIFYDSGVIIMNKELWSEKQNQCGWHFSLDSNFMESTFYFFIIHWFTLDALYNVAETKPVETRPGQFSELWTNEGNGLSIWITFSCVRFECHGERVKIEI